MNPKISIIIAAYNSERYIAKCLDSIFNQTFKDYEVIIVNDGSTDSTQQICERYTSEHDNLILINQENGGIANARNKGIESCNGDYLAFSDSDDFVDPEWLYNLYKIVSIDTNCDLVAEGLIVEYEDKKNIVKIKSNIYKGNRIIDAYLILKKCNIEGFIFNKLYKSSLVKDNHIQFEYTLKEDLLFNLKYLSFTKYIKTINSANYHYVQHGNQSLIHKRYDAKYMKNLITSLYDASMNLCKRCKMDDLSKITKEEYILSYSVLLFSMYRKRNGIKDKTERLKYINDYRQFRKENRHIKINNGNKAKRLFASFMMLPPIVTDSTLSLIIRK